MSRNKKPMIPISARVDEQDLAIAAIYLNDQYHISGKSDLISACVSYVSRIATKMGGVQNPDSSDTSFQILRGLGINWDNSEYGQQQIAKVRLLETITEEGLTPDELEEITQLILDKRNRAKVFEETQKTIKEALDEIEEE